MKTAMKSFNYYKHKISTMSFKTLIMKLAKRPIINLQQFILRYYETRKDFRLQKYNCFIQHSFLDIKKIDVSNIDKSIARYHSEMYINHCFNLLGSGWVKIDYTLNPKGLQSHKYNMSPNIIDFDESGEWLRYILRRNHIEYSKNIWKEIDRKYRPIDWQIDYISGFRWDAKKWAKDQRKNTKIGADLKLPWELSRMQHFPQMAIFAMVLPEYRNKLISEFRNQTLDFIMTNPRNMGVNWNSTMDVALRAANILLAYDLFKQLDNEEILDSKFEEILSENIYMHGDYIITNLEWTNDKSNNHYLANLSGLLWIASYLNSTPITNAWLVFAVQELIFEMEKQFHKDGSNFESSTSYHRLSGEMMIYNTALIYGVLKTKRKKVFNSYNPELVPRLLKFSQQKYDIKSKKFFPDEYLSKLYFSGIFTLDLSKDTGEVFQIGDNDSGRFFKLTPTGRLIKTTEAINKYSNLRNYKVICEEYWDENDLNHMGFIAAISGIFTSNKFTSVENHTLEYSIVESLSGKTKLNPYLFNRNLKLTNIESINIPKLSYTKSTLINIPKLNNRKVNLRYYQDFGVYIFKTDKFILVVNQGNNSDNNGHAHNDKLSFQLTIDNEDVYIDRGTYIYTPLTSKRNEFRSVFSHNVPIVENEEQNEFISPFLMANESKCYLIELEEKYIKLLLIYKEVYHVRSFEIKNNGIEIVDLSNKKFSLNYISSNHEHSNGYGKLVQI